jgi:hypothetical protein
MRRDAGPLLVLLVALAVHLPDLSGVFSSNPLYLVSGLRLAWDGGLAGGTPGWIDWHAGATRQALGTLAARDWLHHVVPWWNPFIGIGLPLGAQPQSSAFFLPFVLLEHFFDGTTYLKVVMQIIAGQAAYALLRQLGVSRAAAVLGGVLWELNGMFAWFGDAPILPLAFLPVCLLGIERALAGAAVGRWVGWRLLAVGLAYLVLAGFPETGYFCGLLALAWAALRFGQAGTARWRFAAVVALGGAVGVAIASPLLLAFGEYLAVAWKEPRFFDHATLLGGNFAQYLFPYVLGPFLYQQLYDVWFRMGGYVGVGPLLLALAGLAGGGRDRGLKFMLAGWVLVALAKSAAMPGVTELVNLLPGVHLMMFHRYIAPTVAFAVCILAMLALDDWRTGRWAAPFRTAALAAGGVFLAGAVVLVLAWPTLRLLWVHPDYRLYPAASLGGAALVVLVLSVVMRRAPGRFSVRAVCAVTMVEAGCLFVFPLFSGARVRALDMAPVQFLQEHIGLQRYYSIGPMGPNYSSYFGVGSINHNYLPLAGNWADYVLHHLDPGVIANIFNGTTPEADGRRAALSARLAEYEALGVKYVIAYKGTDPFPGLPRPHPPMVFADPLAAIYELPHPAPYVEGSAGQCVVHDEGRQRARGHCDAPGAMVRRELFFPGWTATVNGVPAKVERAGEVFQQVALPAGDVFVQFRYAPPFVGWAYAACAVGLGILGGSFLHKGRFVRS